MYISRTHNNEYKLIQINSKYIVYVYTIKIYTNTIASTIIDAKSQMRPNSSRKHNKSNLFLSCCYRFLAWTYTSTHSLDS